MAKYLMIGACEGKQVFTQEYRLNTYGEFEFRLYHGKDKWMLSEFDSINKAFDYYAKQYDVLTIMELPND